jgi:hypothetical protein
MKAKLKILMKDLISEVLSGMFFSPAEFSDDFAPGEINIFLNQKDIIIANIVVEGETPLEVFGAVLPETMEDLAINFTGKSAVSTEDIEGTLMELLNMTGGGIVADFFKGSETKLHIPQIVSKADFLNTLSDKNSEKILFKCLLINGEILFAGSLLKS